MRLELVPAEAVEHEQHGPVGVATGAGNQSGNPVDQGAGPSSAGMIPRTLGPE